jgi:hypothetical protein
LTGQNDREGKNLTGQLRILAGQYPLTGRYFAPWLTILAMVMLTMTMLINGIFNI